MRASDLIRKLINVVDESNTVSAQDWEKNKDIPEPKVNTDEPNASDTSGRIVGRNRQVSYMKPLDKDGDLNVSLGVGKPQMRNLHGKGQSALLTIGGNPGDKKNFAGVQLSQPLSKDAHGQKQGPGISAVYRKSF